MKVYYAHTHTDKRKWETVQEHLKKVGALCEMYAQELQCGDFGRVAGLLHDAGKYSELFQAVLHQRQKHIDHAVPGAVLAHAFGSDSDPTVHALEVIIRAHHSSLQNEVLSVLKQALVGENRIVPPDGKTVSICGKIEFQELMKQIQQELEPELLHHPLPSLPPLEGSTDVLLARMLQTRMLYSCLVDADYTATAEHFDGEKQEERFLNAKRAFDSLQTYRDSIRKNSTSDGQLNQMRDALYDSCRRAGWQNQPGLFTLTAPTGLGKTLALLAFALRHAERWNKKRIFVVLPYLSIIEQNAKEYRKVLPDTLESHSQAAAQDETRQFAERWNAPLVVTTTVGFLEGLFASSAPGCRRLHQAANSVIVFDEAQSLPPKLLDATLNTLRELYLHYNCTVVMSTATQPSFHYKNHAQWAPKEIVENPQNLFFNTRRVRVEWRTKAATSLKQIAQEMQQQKSSCAILNLRRHARKLFELLRTSCAEKELFFLSSDLCPAHRQMTIETIQVRLKAGLPCRVVATQCIEAGVDLSFQAMYRALAPLESVIQAAGRCNRNGESKNLGKLVVFLPDEPGRLYPDEWYENAANQLRLMLENREVDLCNLQDVDEYYRRIYINAPADTEKLRTAVSQMDYQSAEQNYKIIPSGGYRILVPYAGKEELSVLFEKVKKEATEHGVTPALLKDASPLLVNSFDKSGIAAYCEALIPRDYRGRHFAGNAVCYLLDQKDCYDEKTGLYMADDKPFQNCY